MNDEIREILKHLKRLKSQYLELKKIDSPFNDEEYQSHLLLDYITNLQKENEKLKEENKHIFANVNDDELLISNAMNYAEAQDYKSRVEKAIEDIEFCFRFIKQEADMSKDERTRHEMRTCLAIFNETLKSLKNGSDNNV